MNETLDYIESYFENSLTANERMQFEQRISADAAFASEVAFYIQARQTLRNELMQNMKKNWQSATTVEAPKPAPIIPIKKPSLVRRWMAVAAGVVAIVGTSIILLITSNANGLQQMTASIIENKVAHIGGEMGDTEKDRKIQAVEAYNTANYTTAAKIFDSLQAAQPNNTEALEYSGRAALMLKNYDTAISRFEKLSTHTEIRSSSNPGKFYEALAIIQSERPGYKEDAKKLLNEVKANKTMGWEYVEKLLEELSK